MGEESALELPRSGFKWTEHTLPGDQTRSRRISVFYWVFCLFSGNGNFGSYRTCLQVVYSVTLTTSGCSIDPKDAGILRGQITEVQCTVLRSLYARIPMKCIGYGEQHSGFVTLFLTFDVKFRLSLPLNLCVRTFFIPHLLGNLAIQEAACATSIVFSHSRC